MATTTRPDPSAGVLRSTSPIPLRPAVPSSTPVPATRLGRIPLSRPRPSTPDPRFRPSAFSGEAVPFQITAFREGHDRIGVHDLPPVPDKPVRCTITKPDGTVIEFEAKHTFSDEQIEWFKAGSALNIVRAKVQAAK